MMPFALNITATSDDFKNEHITDWEDPAVKRDHVTAYEFVTKEMQPYGLRGFNQTDDSAACGALPLGAYTTIDPRARRNPNPDQRRAAVAPDGGATYYRMARSP